MSRQRLMQEWMYVWLDEEFLKDNGAEFVVHSPEEAWEFINK